MNFFFHTTLRDFESLNILLKFYSAKFGIFCLKIANIILNNLFFFAIIIKDLL